MGPLILVGLAGVLAGLVIGVELTEHIRQKDCYWVMNEHLKEICLAVTRPPVIKVREVKFKKKKLSQIPVVKDNGKAVPGVLNYF